jgi:hypothetical protein
VTETKTVTFFVGDEPNLTMLEAEVTAHYLDDEATVNGPDESYSVKWLDDGCLSDDELKIAEEEAMLQAFPDAFEFNREADYRKQLTEIRAEYPAAFKGLN